MKITVIEKCDFEQKEKIGMKITGKSIKNIKNLLFLAEKIGSEISLSSGL